MEQSMQELYNLGYCDDEIALRIGKAKSTIGQWRKRKGLPLVFENRKRLTAHEKDILDNYLYAEKKFRRITKEQTLKEHQEHQEGLTRFVMSLKHQLSQISQTDVENYIIANNPVDLTRRNELLRTNLVRQFSVPQIPISTLYNFASTIIAKRIFNRDGRCTKCGCVYPLRLQYLAGEFNLLDENLTTLCENCCKMS
jgi:hypothetical protein